MSSVTMPRPRYIAFAVAGPEQPRRAVEEALRAAAKEAGIKAQLTRFAWPHGLVRCEHTEQPALRGALSSLKVGPSAAPVRTLGASGTILALTLRLGILRERTEPKPPAPAARPPARTPPR